MKKINIFENQNILNQISNEFYRGKKYIKYKK